MFAGIGITAPAVNQGGEKPCTQAYTQNIHIQINIYETYANMQVQA